MYNFIMIKFIDLFAGIGTLGIESLSRGAKSIVFVDDNPQVLKVLKKNLDLFSANDYCNVIKSDVFNYLKHIDKEFDVIFADPPYNKFNFFDLLPIIKKKLTKGGVFCYETKKTKFNLDANMKIKNYGNTQIIFWRNE